MNDTKTLDRKIPTVAQIMCDKFSGKSPELASMIGVSNVSTWSWLKGKHLPSRKYARKICKVLFIRYSRFMRSYENDVKLARLKKAKVSGDLFSSATVKQIAKKYKPMMSVVQKEYAKHNKSCSNKKLKLNTHNSPTSVGTLIEIAEMLIKLSDEDKIVLNLLVRHYS